MPNDPLEITFYCKCRILYVPCRKCFWSRHHWGILEVRAGELETSREVCGSDALKQAHIYRSSHQQDFSLAIPSVGGPVVSQVARQHLSFQNQSLCLILRARAVPCCLPTTPGRTCRSRWLILVPPGSISPPAAFFLTVFLFFLLTVSPSSTSPCLHLVSIWTKQMFFHFLNVLYAHLADV